MQRGNVHQKCLEDGSQTLQSAAFQNIKPHDDVHLIEQSDQVQGCHTMKGPCALPPLLLFSQIVGIDLMRSKVRECRILVEVTNKMKNENEKLKVNSDRTTDNIPFQEVHIFEENFLDSFLPSETEGSGWSDADVVYACATCFADDVLLPLVDLFCLLSVGSHVILIDRMVLSDTYRSSTNVTNTSNNNSSNTNNNSNKNDDSNASSNPKEIKVPISHFFSLIGSCQVLCSWGHGCAYVYRKIK